MVFRGYRNGTLDYNRLSIFTSYNQSNYHQSKIVTCVDPIVTNMKNLFELSDIFETGLSDYHMLILTIMKSGNIKAPPRKKMYENFNLDVFNPLKWSMELHSTGNNNSYALFEERFLSVLDKQVPLKTNLRRYNNYSCLWNKEKVSCFD